MFAGGYVFAPLGLGGGFGQLDARGVLAVRQDDGGRVTEDAFEGGDAVDEHVSRGGAHENLYSADLARIDGLDGLDVGVGRSEEEGVVGDRGGRADGVFLFEFRVRGRGRVRVRHLHERRHAAGDGRAGFAGDAGLMRQARLTEMHLVVDQAGEEELAGEVVFLVGLRAGRDRADALDAAVAE